MKAAEVEERLTRYIPEFAFQDRVCVDTIVQSRSRARNYDLNTRKQIIGQMTARGWLAEDPYWRCGPAGWHPVTRISPEFWENYRGMWTRIADNMSDDSLVLLKAGEEAQANLLRSYDSDSQADLWESVDALAKRSDSDLREYGDWFAGKKAIQSFLLIQAKLETSRQSA